MRAIPSLITDIRKGIFTGAAKTVDRYSKEAASATWVKSWTDLAPARLRAGTQAGSGAV